MESRFYPGVEADVARLQAELVDLATNLVRRRKALILSATLAGLFIWPFGYVTNYAALFVLSILDTLGFAGFLAYSWGTNPMGVTEAEQIEHEYYYRSRLVIPGQQPQWLPDAAYTIGDAAIEHRAN